MGLKHYQSSFASGLLSEHLEGQIDLPIYKNGAARLENVLNRPQGGVTQRPGTYHKIRLPVVTRQVEQWLFDENESYLAMFTAELLTMVSNDTGQILQQIAAPWTEEMVRHLGVAQQGDVMIVCHEHLQTRVIRRTSATTFTIELFEFEASFAGVEKPPLQPYWKFLRPEATLTITFLEYPDSADVFDPQKGYLEGTSVMVEASETFFTPDMVGTFVQLDGEGGVIKITEFISATEIIGTVQSPSLFIRLPNSPIKLVEGEHEAFLLLPFHDMVVGDKFYLSSVSLPDTGLVGEVGLEPVKGEKEVLEVTENQIKYYAIDSPIPSQTMWVGGGTGRFWASHMRTRGWKEPLFSDLRGWPKCVTFHDQRLIFGGSHSLPHVFAASRTGAFFNFDTGTGLDDQAIVQLLPSRSGVPRIVSMLSYLHLLIFTDIAEFIALGSENKPVTPASISFKRQSAYGTLDGISARTFDGAAIFLTATNNQMRELAPDVAATYSSAGLSWMAGDIIRNAVDMDVLSQGFDGQPMMAFVVNEDGTMVVFTFIREQKFAAWSIWRTTLGSFRNVCAIRDKLWVVVERSFSGGTLDCSLELFDVNAMMDCQSDWTNPTPSSAIGPFTRFAGQQAYLTTPTHRPYGWVLLDASGFVIGAPPLMAASIGFHFDIAIRTMRAEVALPDGPSPGRRRRIKGVRASLLNTLAMNIRHTELQNLNNLAADPVPFSGIKEFWFLGWDREGRIDIGRNWPVPFSLSSLNIEVEF